MIYAPPFSYWSIILLLCVGWSDLAAAHKKNVLVIMADDFNHWIQPIGYYPEAIPPTDHSGFDISDLAVAETRCNAITLNWGDVNGETGYRVRRFIGDSAVNLTDLAADATSFTDATAEAEMSYTYVVRALVDQRAVGSSNRLPINVPTCDDAPTPDTDSSEARVRVLGPMEDIPRSTEYQVSVSDRAEAGYQEAHVHHTEAREKNFEFGSNGYIAGYRMSYVNFEFEGGEAFVKIKIPGQNVPDFEVRPKRKGVDISYATENGLRVAHLTFPAPTSPYFAASYVSVVPLINGKADITNGLGVFANPFASPPNEGTVVVDAGSSIPTPDQLQAGQTVVFGPGVHELGIEYPLKSEVDYFFMNGAYVKGTFQKLKGDDPILSNVRVYGYGILSTTHLDRFRPNGTKFEYNPMALLRSSNVTIEGITFEDPSHHTLNIGGFGDLKPSTVRKVKILGWRANGDGIHIIGRGTVEDCFLRTQDDAMYIAAGMSNVSFRRITTWNDFNGSAMLFTAHDGGGNVTVSDCDVIYMRSRFNSQVDGRWLDHPGGCAFNMRGLGAGNIVENVAISDVRIDDDQPEKPIFQLTVQPAQINPGAASYTFRNISFTNITAVTNGGYQNVILGTDGNVPEGITFDCVRIGGQALLNLSDWRVTGIDENEITFSGCDADPQTAARFTSPSNHSKDITIYPNPALDKVSLTGERGLLQNIQSVTIYHISGKVVKQFEYTGRTIDVSSLDAGTYIMSVRLADGQNHRSPFLIER